MVQLNKKIIFRNRDILVLEALWLLLEEDDRLLFVRRLLPVVRLTLGRLDGITARDKGGGAGTRDGYEYILVSNKKCNC